MVSLLESHFVALQRRPAMKTDIAALALVFALATGTSMISLTGHADRVHTDQGRPHTALLLY
jgi:hypothetical protein